MLLQVLDIEEATATGLKAVCLVCSKEFDFVESHKAHFAVSVVDGAGEYGKCFSCHLPATDPKDENWRKTVDLWIEFNDKLAELKE